MADQTAQKQPVSYGDFSKLDLRVAKILDVEPVDGSDKLYKLKIRVGADQRQIVAGLAEYYAPDELLGKKIIILANIEPRTIRGAESDGMLLAAVEEKEGKIAGLSLATVDSDEITDGTALS